MKNLFGLLLFFSLLSLSFSCGSNQATNSESGGEDTAAEADKGGMDGEEAAGENKAYSVTVLKSDIPSPRKEMKGSIGDAMVTVNYGSPSVKGRTLWGSLVPYGEIWRAGANEATTFEVSKDITVGGQSLEAGKYGFFLIPKEGNDWDVVFNEVADQWGAYDYDQAKDKLRVAAKPSMVAESSETMDFIIEGNDLVLRWGKLKLSIPISA